MISGLILCAIIVGFAAWIKHSYESQMEKPGCNGCCCDCCKSQEE